jgi:AraC-like DNA-binding protein
MIVLMAAERLSYLLQGASLMFFIFASLSLYKSNQPSRLKRALAFLVAFFAFGEVKDLIRIIPAVTESAYALRLLYSIDMWTIGICATYMIELVRPNWFTLCRAVKMTAIFALFTLTYAFTGNPIVISANLVYVFLFSAVMLIYFAVSIRRYNRFINDNYSNHEHINLSWLKTVLAVFVLCIVVWTIFLFNHNYYMKSIYYVVSLCAWIMLIARSRDQISVSMKEPEKPIVRPAIEVEQPAEPTQTATTEAQPAAEAVATTAPAVEEQSLLPEQMKAQLEELMNVREIYLNSHLTLSDLAAALGTNRTYLSNYLNRELKVSFYDYVNSFRVARACRMIEADPDVTVQDIVESCGFNSVSTFRRSFSREIGKTYGEYRQNVLSR